MLTLLIVSTSDITTRVRECATETELVRTLETLPRWRCHPIKASSDLPSEEDMVARTGIEGSQLVRRDNTPAFFALTLALAFISKFFLLLPLLLFRYEPNRTRRHEAAHFVAGYAAGVPAASVQRSSVEFYDDGQRNRDAVEALAAVALAGAVAECEAFGDSKGVKEDLLLLQRLLNDVQPAYSPLEQQAATRRAVINAHTLLFDEGRGALVDAVARKMEDANCDVADLVAALETAELRSS